MPTEVDNQAYFPPVPTAKEPSRTWKIRDTENHIREFDGKLIGSASSRQLTHRHPANDTTAFKKCSACRWFEIRLFRTDDDLYVVQTSGCSTIATEETWYRYTSTPSAYEVIEILTVRKNNDERELPHAFLPVPSARALAMAAGLDPAIEKAWNNRVTT